MHRILWILSFILVFQLSLKSETNKRPGTISGFVYDEQTGEALIGASLYIEGTTAGAVTNLSGYFVINGVPKGDNKLIISFMGYKTLRTNINNDNNGILKFYLQSDVVKTNEIIISADSVRTIDKLFVKEISRIELSAKQINNIPRVIEADLLRSLQTLPGVQPLSDFSSALYVRGGTPDQNLYLIDGTDVYNPEHAFGLFSTFNTSAIKKVDLSKGGFSAEYGGRLSSVLNVTNLDGNRNEFQGEANISLLSASTTLQTPLSSIGSISGSFRRTYIDQTYARVIDEIPNYYFYDGNLKAFLDLNDKNKLVVSFYGGQDDLDYKFDKNKPNSPGFKYDWGNVTGSINWKRIFSPKLFASFWATGSKFSSKFNFGEFDFNEDNKVEDITFKGNLEYFLNKAVNIKFGFEQKNLHILFKEEFPGGMVDADKFRKMYTAYITSNWRPVSELDIETGVRFDYFSSEKDYRNIDPRVSIKYRLDETTNIKLSGGIFHQYMNRIPRLFFSSIWTTADQYTKGSSASHIILGVQKEIAGIYEFEVEAYYKKYNDLYSFNQTLLTDLQADKYNSSNEPVFTETRGMFDSGDANSYGIELFLRKDYGALTGWIGLSMARTENSISRLNGGEVFVPRHDRTLTINNVTNINIGEMVDEIKGKSSKKRSSKWLFSMNFIYATGQPITLPGSVYTAYMLPDWNNNEGNTALYPAKLNSVRLPAYIRMDVSLTYEKDYGGWILAPYIQVYNIGNRKNVWFIDYDNKIVDNRVVQEIETVNMLPLLPSIGVNIKF